MSACACPQCGADLSEWGEACIVGAVDAGSDPENKSRLDIIIACTNCGTELNTFVAVSELVVIVDEDAA